MLKFFGVNKFNENLSISINLVLKIISSILVSLKIVFFVKLRRSLNISSRKFLGLNILGILNSCKLVGNIIIKEIENLNRKGFIIRLSLVKFGII